MLNLETQNRKLIIISPTKIDKYRKLIDQEGWAWSFMGVNSSLRERTIKLLGSESRHCYAEELQQVCKKQKQPFLDLIAEIGEKQNKTWWATEIAYKSPYTSDLFLNYCFLMLIKQWIENQVTKRIVVVENAWLLKSCFATFDGVCVNIVKDNIYFTKSWIKQQFISYGTMLLFLTQAIRIYTANKVYSRKYRKQLEDFFSNTYDVLFFTWIEERSFKGLNSEFYDPYLGTLSEYCKKMGLYVITSTLPIFPLRLLKKSYESKEIIPSIYFTKISDILKSFLTGIFFRLNKSSDSISKDIATSVLDYEVIRAKRTVCYTFLHFLTTLNMFNGTELSFRVIAYPFENQPWDKMMILAKSEAKAEARMVGCHNIGIPYFFLNFYFGKNESAIHPQPDTIVSNGAYWETVLRNAGFSCNIKNGGSLRFQLGTESDKRGTSSSRNRREKNVLVLLSVSLSYSLDLLFYVMRDADPGMTYFVKAHPDTPEARIRRYLKKLPNNFVFVEGSMEEWMEKVGWAIHVGTNAAIECLMRGINVFKYLPERIDLDPILDMGFDQRVLQDNDRLSFKNAVVPNNIPDSNLIAEPFNKATWKEILASPSKS